MNLVKTSPANLYNWEKQLQTEFYNQTKFFNDWSQESNSILQEYHTLENNNSDTKPI